MLALIISAGISCQKAYNPNSGSSSIQPENAAIKAALLQATNNVFQSGSVQDENLFDAIDDAADLTYGGAVSCKTVTFNPASKTYPYVATVDFGTGCLGSDGVTRKGVKTITYFASPAKADSGTMISQTTYSNYFEDSSQLQGYIKIYVEKAASPGPLVLEYVENQIFTASNGSVSASYGVHDWTQVSGNGSNTRKDDIFNITGVSNGTEILDGATTFSYTDTISALNPIVKNIDCNFRSQGVENVTIHLITGGGGTFIETLDYGTGDCDNIGTLKINGGKAQQITFPLQYWPLSL